MHVLPLGVEDEVDEFFDGEDLEVSGGYELGLDIREVVAFEII